MFLNSLFNTSSTPSVWMNVSDTRKLDQMKGACQSWSCSMEYSSFVYERHLWIMLNAVYVISVYTGADYDTQRPPEAEDRLCWFYRFFRVGFRFRNCLTPNACWFYYRSDLDCYKDPTESACGSTQSRSQYSSHNIAPEPSGKSTGNEIRPLSRNLASSITRSPLRTPTTPL